MSREIFSIDKIFAKNMLASSGLSDEDLKKPLVLILAEEGCGREAEQVKYSVLSNDCAAVLVTLPSLNAQKALDGGNSLLYAREATADLTEALLNTYCADGAAIIAASESAAAGLVMGAVRRNVPLVFLPAFINGNYYPSRLYNSRALVGLGKASLSELENLQHTIRPGRSLEMDNLNSLCVFLEGCGISVPDSVGAITPDEQVCAARTCGMLAAKRAISLSCPRMDLTRELIKCGIAAFAAAGGTASALLHILAIAAENQTELYLKNIAELKLPRLACVSPFGEYSIADFTRAGGVFSILSELSGISKLLPDIKIGEFSVKDTNLPTRNTDVIAKLSSPFEAEGGFGLLSGNLFDYGIFKRETKLKSFKGEAVVMNSEEQFKAAAGSIKNGSAIVIKGQSATERGMPLLEVMSAALAAGLGGIVIITEGRVLESANIPVISLCFGEAFGAVKNGDLIEIDFKKGKVNLNVPGKEITSRIKKQKSVEDALSGGLLRYSRLVGEPDTGCVLKKKF